MFKKDKNINFRLGLDAKRWSQKYSENGNSFESSKTKYESRGFIPDLLYYLSVRSTSLFKLTSFISSKVLEYTSRAKSYITRNIFLGRGSLYRVIFQFSIAIFTIVISFSGFLNEISLEVDNESTVYASGQDILTEYGTGTTVAIESKYREGVVKYTVKSGDTLSSIAEKFEIDVDTLKWGNKITGENINPGQELTILPIDGVMHVVAAGESLASIAKKYKASKQAIADWNWLEPPDFKVYKGDTLIVPGGSIEPPPPPKPIATQPKVNTYSGSYQVTQQGSGVSSGQFGRPTVPGCGYISQGYKPWHQAVDIAQRGGCKLTAIDGGTVTTAGWTAYGFAVYIDHGNGWTSRYGHGNGTFYVSAGQKVSKGQAIMYMGCTGRCTGTHVHLEIRKNGVKQNPLSLIETGGYSWYP